MGQALPEESLAAPFPFLELPKELRLLVYEHLVQLHCHNKIEIPIKKRHVAITLVMPCDIPPIYLACRLVHGECIAIMQARLANIDDLRTVPKLAIPAAYASQLSRYNGLINEVMNMIHFVCHSPTPYVFAAEVEAELTERALDLSNLLEWHSTYHGYKRSDIPPRWTDRRLGYIRASDYSPSVTYVAEAMSLFANRTADHFLGYNHWVVHILVKGKCEGGMKEKLLDRLERRGREYEICIFVFFAEELKEEGEDRDGGASMLRTWVHDEGVISGESRLEE
jgi:hypothetical protein